MKTSVKKKAIVFLIGITICSMITAQTTIVLKPDSATGKDAYLRSLSPNNNYGTHPDFSAHAWTNGGNPVTVRGIIDFDLSSIPSGATINAANLSLFSYDSSSNGSHSTQSGSNEALISRVTSAWDENTVTWNSQPTTTVHNQVSLPASVSSIQDYCIDVANLIQDMINDPVNSHGFLFQLVTEQYYRRMLFASSDHPDSTFHPTLEITFTETVSSHSCLVIRSDSTTGKDAYISSLSPNNNFGTHPDFSAHAWTNGGNEVIVRGIIDFDLSGIPRGATINSASLSLYSYDSPANGSHSNQFGPNESVLIRVTSSWDENTVTWNNQPSTITQNQVFLPSSTSSIQDYINIDVTSLVEDMINDPAHSHGFLFRQVTEQYYRRMLFASSDNPDNTLHPKLEVCFITEENGNNDFEINIFPNPTTNYFTIDLSSADERVISIDIFNSSGQFIERKSNIQPPMEIDVSKYVKGLYFVRIHFNDFVSTKKLIIQ